MGKRMSKLPVIGRTLQNYNLEDRAFKVISRDKPAAAPVHPSYEKVMKEIKEDPELLTKHKLTEQEIKNLSQVYVKSTGINPEMNKLSSSQKLPEDRSSHEAFMYPEENPSNVPSGKLSIRALMELLERRETDPDKYTADVLASTYNISPKVAQDLIDNFRTFSLYHKPKEDPSLPVVQRTKEMLKYPFKFTDQKHSPDPRANLNQRVKK